MEEFQQEFLDESISALETFRRESQTEFSENSRRALFRVLHTIKGTAQTFGFGRVGTLAHDIENLLAARERRVSTDGDFSAFLREGLEHLSEILKRARAGEEFVFPHEFSEKVRQLTDADARTGDSLLRLPPEIGGQLSPREKDSLEAAIENGKNLFLIEAGFSFDSFENDFKELRNILDAAGAVVAAFPSLKFATQIGFQVFLATEKTAADVSRIGAPYAAEIIYKIENDSTLSAKRSLEGVLRSAVEGAKNLSKYLGKEVTFDVSFDESEIPARRLKVIFDALLHLTRNAIDHGIEKTGKITIRLASNDDALRLTVTDDGRGIDLEKVRAKAIENHLISAADDLSRQQLLDLIFAHGFSTGETVTEISGRGVGLDAVKDAVEKAGGTIGVASEEARGTNFEIYLPKN